MSPESAYPFSRERYVDIHDLESWGKASFEYSDKLRHLRDCNASNSILIQEAIEVKNYSKERLKEYAHDNLRVFDMKAFEDHILELSPRELK